MRLHLERGLPVVVDGVNSCAKLINRWVLLTVTIGAEDDPAASVVWFDRNPAPQSDQWWWCWWWWFSPVVFCATCVCIPSSCEFFANREVTLAHKSLFPVAAAVCLYILNHILHYCLQPQHDLCIPSYCVTLNAWGKAGLRQIGRKKQPELLVTHFNRASANRIVTMFLNFQQLMVNKAIRIVT